MKLLQKAESTMAFFKCGIFGFQGSGKTYSATQIAIGILNTLLEMKLIESKQLAFFDTETGSDFMLPKLKQTDIETFQTKSRAFGDLLQVIHECENEKIPFLLIDSITHVWRDLCDSYDKKLKRNGRLQFQDWAIIKREWQQYTDLFVNSNVHIIVCGRAGYDYDYDYNDDGSKDLVKTGTKMKTETEFGFEPSLVIEMERVSESAIEIEKMTKRTQKQSFTPKVGSMSVHRAHILKDRTDTMNGRRFEYSNERQQNIFDDLKPHFDALNIGGEHLGVDTSRNSEDRFNSAGRPDWKQRQIEKDIALEEIQGTMMKLWPGQGKEEKASKLEFLEVVFDKKSWKAIEEERLETLKIVQALLKPFEEIYLQEKDIIKAWDKVQKGPTSKEPHNENDIPI